MICAYRLHQKRTLGWIVNMVRKKAVHEWPIGCCEPLFQILKYLRNELHSISKLPRASLVGMVLGYVLCFAHL